MKYLVFLINEIFNVLKYNTAWKLFKYGVSSGSSFPVFSPNTEEYGPEKTPYLDIFHAVLRLAIFDKIMHRYKCTYKKHCKIWTYKLYSLKSVIKLCLSSGGIDIYGKV